MRFTALMLGAQRGKGRYLEERHFAPEAPLPRLVFRDVSDQRPRTP